MAEILHQLVESRFSPIIYSFIVTKSYWQVQDFFHP